MIPHSEHHTYISNGSLYIKQTVQVNMYKNEILLFLELLLLDFLHFGRLHNHLFKKTPGNHFWPFLLSHLQSSSSVQGMKDISAITLALPVFTYFLVPGHQCSCQHCYWHLPSNPSQCHAPRVLVNTLSTSAVNASCSFCPTAIYGSSKCYYLVYVSAL